MSWFVVRTKPRQEFIAKANLENQGFEYYLPVITFDNGKTEPLFPGYIFIRNQAGPTPFDKIRYTKGVLNYVKFGNTIAVAKQSLIESLVEREEDYKSVARIKPHQKVIITSGPFQELDAIFVEKSGRDRVIVLLELLNSEQKVALDASSVRLA